MKAVVPMTGTVIKGKLDSAYPILHAMAPLYYGSYEAFLNHHCLRDDYGTVLGWKNHDRLGLILQAVGVRRSFESIFGKEAKVLQIEKCEMTQKQRDAYDDMEALGLVELDDKFLTADGKGVQAIRCRQIMAHPETMGLIKEGEKTGKDERLWIHIEDHVQSGEQLAIFSALVPEQERIYKQLSEAGHRVALINGSVSGPKRQQIDEDFRAGKIQFIIGSPATMAVGFNWGMLNTIIFVSLDYGDDSFVQAYRRAIRGKRETPLLIIVLEYENSIDQRIFEVVQGKSKDANLIDSTKEEINLGQHKDVVGWLRKGLVK
jgi:SNF2 family DNA or RNA helicase